MLVGCGRTSWPPKLSEEERVRWEKFRKQATGKYVFGLQAKSKKWKVLVQGNDWNSVIPDLIGPRTTELYAGESDKVAEQWATKQVASPDINATAIVDFASAETPTVVAWFVSDGGTVKKSDTPPSPAMEEGLREFLSHLVKTAGGR